MDEPTSGLDANAASVVMRVGGTFPLHVVSASLRRSRLG